MGLRTIGVLAVVLGAAACGNAESSKQGDQDITGTSDLAAIEAELALTLDAPAEGQPFQRSDAVLTAGPCYARTVGKATDGGFEVRRYTNAAMYHRKAGADETRPIVCLDLDVGDRTVAIDRFQLDAMMRYHLGREVGETSAPGRKVTTFERGAFDVAGDPAAAQVVVNEPKAKKTAIDAPQFRGEDLLSITPADARSVSGATAKIVYTFAWRTAKASDVFSNVSDPVGKFLSSTASPDGAVERLLYERCDVFRVQEAGGERIFISTTGGGEDDAVVRCVRGPEPDATFACTGL